MLDSLRARQTQAATTAPPDFENWLYEVSPGWPWHYPHLKAVQQNLDKLTRGEIKRLMIFMPPRHYKTETVTVRYATWRIERDPSLRVIVGAYSQDLASTFSRKARKIATGRIALDDTRQAAHDWQTAAGGGYRSVGVGAGVTGHGARLILADDPIKNREEANSPTYRRRVWEWWRDDLMTRQEAGCQIILITTRWHIDDLAGRLLEQERNLWTVLSLPAEAEANDPLGRELYAPLCSEIYDAAKLAEFKGAPLGPFAGIPSWYALFQQRPVPQEGEMFKRAWFEIVDAVPADAQRVRYWDKAGTEGGGARTAGVKIAEKVGTFYIEDCIAGQWGTDERERIILQTAQLDNAQQRIVTWIEQEPGSGGKESAEATIKRLAGFLVFADKVTGDKVTRAEPMVAQAAPGNVKIVRGAWNQMYLDELINFPSGKFKDMVDASSGAFNKLASTSRIGVSWL
jgi:predicted phage terminase large subunit-like protein